MKLEPWLTCGLCLGALASLTLQGWAAEPRPNAADATLSLDRAIRLAMENNATLRASAARKEAAVGRAVQARAWPNPELELSNEDIPASRSRLSQSKRMAGISQTIPYPGKKRADREIGDADAAAAAARHAAEAAAHAGTAPVLDVVALPFAFPLHGVSSRRPQALGSVTPR